MISYFLEINNRIILIAVSLMLTIILSYLYKEIILFFIYQYNIKICFYNLNYFIFTGVTEIFFIYVKILSFLNIQYFIFYFILNTFAFLTPSLSKKEFLFFRCVLRFLFVAWLISNIFYTLIVTPLISIFFLGFYKLIPFNSYLEAKLNDYLDFYFLFYYNNLVYSQVFSFIFLITYFFNLKIYSIKKFRKIHYYFLIFFIITISPPNLYTHIHLNTLFIFFFEYSFFIAIYRNSFIKLIS